MKKIGFFGFLTYPEVKILQKQTFRLKTCHYLIPAGYFIHASFSTEHFSVCMYFLHHRRRYQKSQKINIFHSKVSCKLSPFIKLKKFDSYVSERYVNILYKLQKSNENAKILRKSMNMRNVQR